jgi:hypothetical protein
MVSLTCEQEEERRINKWRQCFKNFFESKREPKDIKGTVFTKDGVYVDGVLLEQENPEQTEEQDHHE